MFNRLKRLRRLWPLTQDGIFDSREVETIELIQGDGNAMFLSDMTEQEMTQYIKEEEHGWGAFYQKIKDALK